MDTILFGFGGCAFLGLIGFFLTSGKGSAILNSVHQVIQDKFKKNIDKVESQQVVIKSNISNKEQIDIETKEKIKEIQKKASVEIQEVLKEKNLSKIAEEIDKEWENI